MHKQVSMLHSEIEKAIYNMVIIYIITNIYGFQVFICISFKSHRDAATLVRQMKKK